MKTSTPRLARLETFRLTVVLLMCVGCQQGLSQVASRNDRARSSGIVGVEHVRQLRRGVDAWPLILKSDTPAAQRVNATLTGMNHALLKSLRECDKDYLAWARVMGHSAVGRKEVTGDWSRKVIVTMKGPHFLSLVGEDDVFCGGAHPDIDRIAIMFDLGTGDQVNWTKMLAESTGASGYSDSVSDGENVNAIVLPALMELSEARAVSDCKGMFNDRQAYVLWPDAKRERLVAEPIGLSHAVQACGEQFSLTIEQAREMGFSESLLSAIDEAHRIAASKVKPARKSSAPTEATRPDPN